MKKFKLESLSQEGSVTDLDPEQFNFMNKRVEDFENNDVNPRNIERLLEEM